MNVFKPKTNSSSFNVSQYKYQDQTVTYKDLLTVNNSTQSISGDKQFINKITVDEMADVNGNFEIGESPSNLFLGKASSSFTAPISATAKFTTSKGIEITSQTEKLIVPTAEIRGLNVQVLNGVNDIQLGKIPNLQNTNYDVASKISGIETNILNNTSSINSINTSISNINAKNTSQDSSISSINTSINNINTTNTNQDSAILNLIGEVNGIKSVNTSQNKLSS